ncbi:hypothetical protein C8J56DRAFT_785915, partial [Mycena floridula]
VHLGIWRHYAPEPFPTSPTMNQTQAVEPKVNELCGIVQEIFSQKLSRIMARYLPKQLQRKKSRQHCQVRRHLNKLFQKRPKLDFGPPFFTVAVKSGSSEILHLDMMDDAEDFTWITVVGDFTGGYFYAPQFGICIPVFPGQVLGVLTRWIAHCSIPITSGRRVVYTLFSDKFIMQTTK